jgi:hypothetical protein
VRAPCRRRRRRALTASITWGQTLIAIRERIGVLPHAEESEEVRLELLRLTKALLLAQPSAAREHIDHVATILERSSYDKFPDVKKLASELIVWLSARPEVARAQWCLHVPQRRARVGVQPACFQSAPRNSTRNVRAPKQHPQCPAPLTVSRACTCACWLPPWRAVPLTVPRGYRRWRCPSTARRSTKRFCKTLRTSSRKSGLRRCRR